jgi:hypothetical protein
LRNLFITVFFWSPHLETSVYLAAKQASSGNNVKYCFLIVKNIEEKTNFFEKLCKINKLIKFFKNHEINWEVHFCEPLIPQRKFNVTSLNHIIKLKHKGEKLGLGLASTLSDLHCNHKLDLKNLPTLSTKLFHRAANVYDKTISIIKKYQPDNVYSFNPRFSNTRPIYFAAKKFKLQFLTYEIGSNERKYYVSDRSIFDGVERCRLIKAHWGHGSSKKRKIAKEFFLKNQRQWINNKEKKPGQDAKSYIHPNKINVLFCPSSVEETFALGDLYPKGIFRNQIDALRYLIKIAEKQKKINLILKVHPIITKKSPAERKLWESFRIHKHVKYIAADSELSFYQLLNMVDRVIVYHSSTAVEAAFRKKSSMALGSPWYIDLGCIFRPKTKNDIQEYIFRHKKIKKNLKFENSLMYGYYLKTFGDLFQSDINEIKKFLS